MSYGRKPYYIFDDGESINFYESEPVGKKVGPVPHAAMQQFIASLAWRGTDKLQDWIDAGCALRPELGKITVEVKVVE